MRTRCENNVLFVVVVVLDRYAGAKSKSIDRPSESQRRNSLVRYPLNTLGTKRRANLCSFHVCDRSQIRKSMLMISTTFVYRSHDRDVYIISRFVHTQFVFGSEAQLANFGREHFCSWCVYIAIYAIPNTIFEKIFVCGRERKKGGALLRRLFSSLIWEKLRRPEWYGTQRILYWVFIANCCCCCFCWYKRLAGPK